MDMVEYTFQQSKVCDMQTTAPKQNLLAKRTYNKRNEDSKTIYSLYMLIMQKGKH